MPEKILINLLSAQTMPNYIAVKQFQPDRVIALATSAYASQITRMANITGAKHQKEDISAYGLKANSERIRKLLRELPSDADITVNFTGGTKLMSLAAALPVLEGVQANLRLAYVDTHDSEVIIVEPREDRSYRMERVPISVTASFTDFVGLAGETLSESTDCISAAAETRLGLSEALLNRQFNKVFSKQRDMFDRTNGRMQAKQKFSMAFQHRSSNGRVSWDPSGMDVLAPDRTTWTYRHRDSGGYFTGGWLEELVFVNLLKHRSIDSVAMNVVLTLSEETLRGFNIHNRRSSFTDKNELDVVAIKGVKGAIIECKAGNVRQEHIYKLATLRDHLFGIFGVAVLACRFPISSASVAEKARDSRITVVSAERINGIGGIVSDLLR